MVIIVRKCYQKSVDMGRKLEENMYGWVGFFISGPHTPVTFLVKYPPGKISCRQVPQPPNLTYYNGCLELTYHRKAFSTFYLVEEKFEIITS